MRNIFAVIAILLAALAVVLLRCGALLVVAMGMMLISVTLSLWYACCIMRGLGHNQVPRSRCA